jgi:selenocysteine lyase/cysteine desulfurase
MGKDVNNIQAYFNKNHHTNIHVVNPDKGKPWVRVSFPYFLEVSEVDNLVNIIAGALK